MGCARLRRSSRSDNGASSHNPRPRRSSQGTRRRYEESSQTVSLGGSVLPLSSDGHLLEIRNQAKL